MEDIEMQSTSYHGHWYVSLLIETLLLRIYVAWYACLLIETLLFSSIFVLKYFNAQEARLLLSVPKSTFRF